MSTTLIIVLAVSAIAALVHPVLMRTFARSIQPRRLALAAVGDELLTSPHLSDREKDVIDRMLDDAYSCMPMLKMTVVMPWVFARCMFDGPFRETVRRSGPRPADKDTMDRVKRFKALFMQSISAANPFATLVCMLEIGLIAFLLFPLGRLAMTLGIIQTALTKSEEDRNGSGHVHA